MQKSFGDSFWIALAPILLLIGLLSFNVIVFDNVLEIPNLGYDNYALGGPNQMALLLSAAFAGLLGLRQGITWGKMMDGMVKSIGSVMSSVFILLLIGALAGTWLLSGTIPGMIYYGLDILHPSIFLVATCIICALVSLATGSSWGTIATIGIALLGIGKALGFSEGLTAGAIISGAYFGDKISPLSDTTNLAPAMAGTDLFTHIRYMLYTTVPSFIICLIIFLVIGFQETKAGIGNISEIQTVIKSHFHISPLILIVPAVVIGLILKKIPAVPALLAGTLAGGIYALIFQPEVVSLIGGNSGNYFIDGYRAVFQSMVSNISVPTENATINDLLSTGGMYGMLNTIWLILCAMIFGGIMETCGYLQTLSKAILKRAKSVFGLFAATTASCLGFNLTASDQYLAIVVPGRMYADAFRKKGLAPENLSRTLEDTGTVTSVLIPWNTCGATQSAVLGVATVAYLPYCFFNLISPIMTLIYAAFQIKIRMLKDAKSEVKLA